MKTFLKIISIIIILVLAAAFVLPIIFKGKIIELAKEEINKSVDAKVDFTHINLSLFKAFPDFNLGIRKLSVVGLDSFENDTLALIGSIDITLDLMSVINGDQYEIKKIKITDPQLSIKVLEDGSANYDISPAPDESDAEISEEDTEESAFNLALKLIEITNASVRYVDKSMHMTMDMENMNHILSGNMTSDITTLKTKTTIGSFDFDYEGIKYLNNALVNYDADIKADMKNEIYTLQDNNLKINEIILKFEGAVSMLQEGYNLVLAFSAPKTNFKHLLSMIPAIYQQDFESLKTSGELAIGGNIKGLYNDTHLPAFDVNLRVSDAMFQYPDLPESVKNVNINTNITNPGGDADNTVVDISQFHLELGSNPIDITMNIKNPVSDPNINGKLKGKLDLGTVKNYYPLEKGDELSGSFVADVTLSGKLSAIENENFDDFTALGSMLIKDLKYRSEMVNDEVEVSNAQLNFAPEYLDLVSFKLKIGENDFNAKGKIENYLGYVFKDDVLKGNLITQSNYFNVGSILPEDEASESLASVQDEEYTMSVIEIPSNIDFIMSVSFEQLIYDIYDLSNVNGKILIKDEKLTLDNLNMNLLDGEIKLSGYYTAIDVAKPEFDFSMNINEIDIQQAYNTFGTLSEYAPIAKKTEGKFSTEMTLNSVLDKEMMPVYETMTGKGKLKTSRLTIQDVNTLNKLGELLKYDKIKRMVIDKIQLEFQFIDGKLLIEPFDMKVNNYKATLGGWTGFDQHIDYALNLQIPRSEFGGAANDFLEGLVKQANDKGAKFSLGETVSLNAGIGGTLTNPTIETNLKETGKNMADDLKKQIDDEVEKKKEELRKEAQAEADKILSDANKQADKLVTEANKQAAKIRKEAKSAAKKITNEAEKQAKKVEEEGKKKGFLAEAAAKETAKQMRKEAQKQADNVIEEGNKQAEGIENKAKSEAIKIKAEAKKNADKVLEGF